MWHKKWRQKIVRLCSPVSLSDNHNLAPISRIFGLDRGTPIDRYYVELFLEANTSAIRGTVLEIAESRYSRKFGKDVEKHLVLNTSLDSREVSIVGDLTIPDSLPANVADCFICTQTLNFIFDVSQAVQGIHRLLKPGGTLLATVVGISQISSYDMERWGDFWRFTTASMERLFVPVFGDGVQVRAHGNVLAATAFLQGAAVEDLPDPSLLDVCDPEYQLLISVVARKEQPGC